MRTARPILQVIDQHIIKHAGLLVLVVHIQVDVLNAIIEHPLWDVQLRRLHLQRPNHLQQLLLSLWRNLVLEVERRERQHHHQHNQWSHRANQRYARCLDGQQLQAFTQIAKRNQARQQDGQRQRRGHQRLDGIEEELRIHIHRQPLTHQVIDVLPQKLHHDDKRADAERACKQREEIPQNKHVQSLDESHLRVHLFVLTIKIQRTPSDPPSLSGLPA